MKFPIDFCPPEGVDVTEYETVINWLHDGVFYIYAKPEIQHTVEDALKQFAFVEKQLGPKGKMIIDIRNAPPLSVEARNYYSSEEAQQLIHGTCLLIKSPVSRVVGNFYFGFLNKKAKTKMVSNVQDGLDWLGKI